MDERAFKSESFDIFRSNWPKKFKFQRKTRNGKKNRKKQAKVKKKINALKKRKKNFFRFF